MASIDWEDNPCVVCGNHNPVGLQARFVPRSDGGPGVESRVRLPAHWSGFRGLAHGGMLAGIMDDAMWHAIYQATGRTTMTAGLTVRYRAPVPLERAVLVRGWVERVKGRLAIAHAEVVAADGEGPGPGVLAEAEGRFLPAPDQEAVSS